MVLHQKVVCGLEKEIRAVSLLCFRRRSRCLTHVLIDNFQKLQSLFEDIIEESDSFPANPAPDNLASAKYFSSVCKQGDQPLLAQSAIEKITQYVTRVQSSKRGSDSDSTEWDVEVIGRILKLVEGSMSSAEAIELFPEDRKGASSVKAEKKSGQKGRKGMKGGRISKSPTITQQSKEEGAPEVTDTLNEVAIEAFEERLAVLRTGGLAAECCLVLLDSEGLSKQVRGPDPNGSCLTVAAPFRRPLV